MTRRGFTLIELLLALSLTGVVALLVWGVGRAATDGRERVARAQESVRARAALRVVLDDALRHTMTPVTPGEVPVTIEDATGPAGAPRDRLAFVGGGSVPPLSADVAWAITLEVTDAGLELRAVPRPPGEGPGVTLRLDGVSGLDVAALDGGGAWITSWRGPGLPRAVAVVPRGPGAPAPLVVALPGPGTLP